MKADQNTVTSLLRDTVLLFCKNGFNYKNHVKVQGLLGITLDNDEVVLVHVNETVSIAKSDTEPEDATEEDGEENTSYEPSAKATPPARRASKWRPNVLACSAAKTTIQNKQKLAKQSSDATAAQFKGCSVNN